jgi:hypothetical protein
MFSYHIPYQIPNSQTNSQVGYHIPYQIPNSQTNSQVSYQIPNSQTNSQTVVLSAHHQFRKHVVYQLITFYLLIV